MPNTCTHESKQHDKQIFARPTFFDRFAIATLFSLSCQITKDSSQPILLTMSTGDYKGESIYPEQRNKQAESKKGSVAHLFFFYFRFCRISTQ
jgi:hypothetical protein